MADTSTADTPPRPPKAQPNPANKNPGRYCEECKNKKCTETRVRGQYYGCWCGSERAPAAGDLEKKIPDNEAKWGKFIQDEGLPEPKDAVDRCCMQHDLRLGLARQSDPSNSFSSGSLKSAVINSKLSGCFADAIGSKDVDGWGKLYAGYSSPALAGVSGYNLGKLGVNAAGGAISSGWSSLTGALGFGGGGAAGAASSAGASGGW